MNSYKSFFKCLVLASFACSVTGCLGSDGGFYSIDSAIGKDNLVPVVVIGSGPAGLSAALYTCRANFKTLVITGDEPGGQLTKTTFVENWPGVKRSLGSHAINTVKEQAQAFGAEFLPDIVVEVDFSVWPFIVQTQGGVTLHAMSVVIGTGAKPRYLGVPGEEEYWGGGVTACALCDAPFYKGEEVVIIGGGDAAVEEAIQLSSYAKKVTMIVRKGKMRAAWSMQNRLNGYPNISIMYNVEVKETIGEGGFVTGVNLLNNMTDEIFTFPTNGVFLAIGRIPNSPMFKKYLDMDLEGHIKIKKRSQATSCPGIFAAGDVADPTYRQAGIAAGDGIKAGIDVSRYLAHQGISNLFVQQVESTFFKGGTDGGIFTK